MSRRALGILLGVLAALALVIGLGSLANREPAAGTDRFLPELAPELANLTGVQVTGPGDTVIARVTREGDRWVVQEAGGYPADVAKLRQNLQALAEARRLEEKTSSPGLYDRLGVADPGQAGSRAIRLEFQGPNPVPAVIVGDTGVNGADAAYLRRAGEATSWLVSGRYSFGKLVGDWLDRALVDLPADRVRGVTITQPDGAVLRLTKADASTPDFTVADIPKGRTLSFEGVANGVGGALSGLTLDGVAKREVLGATPPKPVVARFEAFDGLVVEASAWRLADGTRFTFLASAPADAAEAKAAADAINARLGGWVYTLPSFKAELLTRRMDDLLQP